MNKPTRQWPHDYHAWTGSFADLVTTAAEVVSSLDPSAKLPTERALRDYQQRGLLGRGTKLPGGNRSVFTFEDLDRVVATKGLVQKKFKLEHAESLLNSASAAVGPVSNMVYASPQSAPSAWSAAVGGSLESAPSMGNASDLVARMMARSPQAGFQGALQASVAPAGLSPSASKAAAPLAAQAYVSTPVESARPTSWLTIYLDPSAAQGAPETERALARAALQSVLDRLG